MLSRRRPGTGPHRTARGAAQAAPDIITLLRAAAAQRVQLVEPISHSEKDQRRGSCSCQTLSVWATLPPSLHSFHSDSIVLACVREKPSLRADEFSLDPRICFIHERTTTTNNVSPQPFELDYLQVLTTTCDTLIQVYSKISTYLGGGGGGGPSRNGAASSSSLGGGALSQSLAEVVVKIDTKLKVSLHPFSFSLSPRVQVGSTKFPAGDEERQRGSNDLYLR